MPKFRNGRAPGHGQDNALDAFEAWLHSADTALDAFEAWLYAPDLLNRNGIPELASGVEIDPESHEISFLLVWRAKDIAPVFEPGELAAMKAMADDEVMDTLAKRFGTLAAMLDDGSDDGRDTRH
jgi:hypothetical protein